MIEMLSVVSSNILAVGYDEQTQTLAVEFKNGLYHYYNFPEHLYQQFLQAPSKGSFLNTYINNQYPYDKVG